MSVCQDAANPLNFSRRKVLDPERVWLKPECAQARL